MPEPHPERRRRDRNLPARPGLAPSGEASPSRGQPDLGRKWLARAAFVAMAAGFVILLAARGAVGLTLLTVGLVGAAAVLVGGYWFLAYRGILRWIGLTLIVVAIALVLVVFVRQGVTIWALFSVALLLIGGAAARHALRPPRQVWMPLTTAPAPASPFIVMNPRSGGGKVAQFDLRRKAEDLGAEVALLDGPGLVDVAALVRDAVDRGADLLGVAGGDGTQALVAGIAVERDIPLLVISAGTRNHFALDLGLDRDDPSTCLRALIDGEEVRVDLGMIGDRPFVNNASFGVYAEIVQSPNYRDNKNRTILEMLPDLLSGQGGTDLTARVGDRCIEGLQAVLVSNNPYELVEGRRARLDQGRLGVLAAAVSSTGQALSLMRRREHRGITSLVSADGVVIEAAVPTIPVGIDGEAVTVPTPVRCTVRPQALRVRLPKDRPGVLPPRPPIKLKRLWHIAFPPPSDRM